MGLLGTIVSIVPTVADIVGKLFGAKSNDYVKFKMFHSAKNDYESNIYFKKLLMEKLCFIILAVSQFTFLWKRQVLKVMKAM